MEGELGRRDQACAVKFRSKTSHGTPNQTRTLTSIWCLGIFCIISRGLVFLCFCMAGFPKCRVKNRGGEEKRKLKEGLSGARRRAVNRTNEHAMAENGSSTITYLLDLPVDLLVVTTSERVRGCSHQWSNTTGERPFPCTQQVDQLGL
jgi:hypothetical protein